MSERIHGIIEHFPSGLTTGDLRCELITPYLQVFMKLKGVGNYVQDTL